MTLKLNGANLYFADLVHNHDADLMSRLIRYIDLKKDTEFMGYIEVVNPCDACGHFVESKSHDKESYPFDFWRFSVYSDDEADNIDRDWKEIMDANFDWTQDEVRVYRCCGCHKWTIVSDC